MSQIGLFPEILPANIDESVNIDESPEAYVTRMAREKCESVDILTDKPSPPLQSSDSRLCFVIGADTSVIFENEIIGKPQGLDDFRKTMCKLSGNKHHVFTGVTVLKYLLDRDGLSLIESRDCLVSTQVKFRSIEDSEALSYWKTGEPLDKAGGYGIQGFGAVFVEEVHGCYNNVVGLPLASLAGLLRELGYPFWNQADR